MANSADIETGPADNPDLIGHQAAETAFLDTLGAGRLPHAWLLAGPRGVGKATLAFRIARFLLAGGSAEGDLFGGGPDSLYLDPEDPVFHRVAGGAHGDLVVIERQENPRTGKLRGEIVIDQVRALGRFFALTSAEGGWRIAIVDGADEMNVNAANALLKVLEEPPPNCLLLLPAHAPGRLLPTIRSRCRLLSLRPLADAQVAEVLARRLPELDDGERLGLARLAEGSPGRAVALAAQGGLETYGELIALLRDLPRLDYAAVHGLGDRLARANGEAAYRVWIDLLALWLTRLVRGRALPGGLDDAVTGEAELAGRLTAGGGLDRWVELWEKVGRLAARADSVNLDRKQVVLNAVMALENTARQ
ncbi:MAG: DNA polymerase III subunit delta' [Alphaproteobacteria bacterium]|jgi:DNA polymerase-3 subunit delta'|nr:DNA polymerase III subunit delta' [Alphaproteobacteria bacterium]MDP6816242.1 DNA polymerase III subunit delta' [Alphaproteobacteria bacterium]